MYSLWKTKTNKYCFILKSQNLRYTSGKSIKSAYQNIGSPSHIGYKDLDFCMMETVRNLNDLEKEYPELFI